ncbi:MAG: HD domain-containing protein [Bacteroidota bacterium]|nr:HD domain-containing protein [Bacteroidota bacterium]MEC7814608.1 HD domain-containing protein [Bacteroidota bacterium]MEC8004600.1 HD domain-containing protein [Bacteroidota bacterium]MEC8605842.1 HD domain-containing protein [Bacteroidota bacterium]
MNKNKVSKILNDPVYGFITLNRGILLDLIDHPYFQRLSRIKQLGLTYLVYPGAHHTRFHHAVGAAYLMKQALSTFKELGVNIQREEERGALIAILLHDIGHGPYSHALEHSFLSGVSHENVSEIFMRKLDEQYNGELSLAIQIFRNEYHKKFLHQLVSSQLDMDRLDYLKRDSFFTGVSEGVVSNQRIIKMFDIVDDEILIKEKGIYSIEKFIVARRLMYWQVYLHKTVLSAEFLLAKIISRARELLCNGEKLFVTPELNMFLTKNISKFELEQEVYLNAFASLDDNDIMTCIKVWMQSKDIVLSRLASMLIERKLLKVKISNTSFNDEQVNEIRKIHQKELGMNDHEIKYFVFQEQMINNAYDPRKDTIKIKYKDGTVKDITDASDNLNVSALAKPVTKHYLFAPYF